MVAAPAEIDALIARLIERARVIRDGRISIGAYLPAMAAELESSAAALAALKADARDAARYREYRQIIYIDKDESFDAYDEEGMDAELDRRIAARAEKP